MLLGELKTKLYHLLTNYFQPIISRIIEHLQTCFSSIYLNEYSHSYLINIHILFYLIILISSNSESYIDTISRRPDIYLYKMYS